MYYVYNFISFVIVLLYSIRKVQEAKEETHEEHKKIADFIARRSIQQEKRQSKLASFFLTESTQLKSIAEKERKASRKESALSEVESDIPTNLNKDGKMKKSSIKKGSSASVHFNEHSVDTSIHFNEHSVDMGSSHSFSLSSISLSSNSSMGWHHMYHEHIH